MVPEDRKKEGLSLILSVSSNLSMSILERLTRFGFVKSNAEKKLVQMAIKNLSIRTSSVMTEVQYLSGGNQQKVVIAKWLGTEPDLLIFDEPTQGVDVGARAEIYRLINEQARAGKAVLLISSDFLEIIGLADRALVVYEGTSMGELRGEEITEENIMTLATGLKNRVAKNEEDSAA